jgi:SAM-dependent methyltransferase
MSRTKEPQYESILRIRDSHGVARLGIMANESWFQDPKRMLFTLVRYKFVAKMLAGREHVLEVGCADAFGTRLVQQTTGAVTAVDFDPVFIADAQERADSQWPLRAFVHDMLGGPVPGSFDAAFALDVLEHIALDDEPTFLDNLCASLAPNGIAVVGMPSLESQIHASASSAAGHVNCKTGPDLKRAMERHFHTVFVFSMNDEVVHTGFYPMAQYLLAVCSHLRT